MLLKVYAAKEFDCINVVLGIVYVLVNTVDDFVLKLL